VHAFEQQDCSHTLAQGLAEYHQSNPLLAKGRGLSAPAQEFFRCHDAVHVVFGCSTALDDEAAVKIASLVGTTGGWRVLAGYRLQESMHIYRRLHWRDVLRSIAHAVVVVPRTLRACARQRRRWPWDRFDSYLSMPLNEIRTEFGITVAHRSARR
jgi:ubiquinone biosynthesis protein Coq4